MNSFSQGGAYVNGAPPRTKKALKEAVKADAEIVQLYSTSQFNNEWSGRASELPNGYEFNVVGPNPYSSRDWYATVKYNSKGVLVVT